MALAKSFCTGYDWQATVVVCYPKTRWPPLAIERDLSHFAAALGVLG